MKTDPEGSASLALLKFI